MYTCFFMHIKRYNLYSCGRTVGLFDINYKLDRKAAILYNNRTKGGVKIDIKIRVQ